MGGDSRELLGAEDMVFGSGTFVRPGSTPARINASHLPFVAGGGLAVEKLVDGSKNVPLLLPAPTVGDHPATKTYVDDALAGQRYAKGISSGLVVKNNATNPNIQVDIDADSVVLNDYSTGNPVFIATDINLTVDITDLGVINGLDTGTEAIDTWYYLWVIYNPTTQITAGLISTSPTAPTLPSGYTYQALVSAVLNDSTGPSGDFYGFDHVDDEWQYRLGDINFSVTTGSVVTLDTKTAVPYALVKETRGFILDLGAAGTPEIYLNGTVFTTAEAVAGKTAHFHRHSFGQATPFSVLTPESSSAAVNLYVYARNADCTIYVRGFSIKK